jgi:hypothetical protein
MALEEGINAIKSGQVQEAINQFREELLTHPRNADGWMWMSVALDNPEKKRECLLRALEIEPDNLTAKRKLAFLDQNHPPQAARSAALPVSSQPRTLAGEPAPFVATPLSKVEQSPAARPVPSQPVFQVEPAVVKPSTDALISEANPKSATNPVFTLSVQSEVVLENPSMHVFTFEAPEPVDLNLDPRTKSYALEPYKPEAAKTSSPDSSEADQGSARLPATAPISSKRRKLPRTKPLSSAERSASAVSNSAPLAGVISQPTSRTKLWTLVLLAVFLLLFLITMAAIIYSFRGVIYQAIFSQAIVLLL